LSLEQLNLLGKRNHGLSRVAMAFMLQVCLAILPRKMDITMARQMFLTQPFISSQSYITPSKSSTNM